MNQVKTRLIALGMALLTFATLSGCGSAVKDAVKNTTSEAMREVKETAKQTESVKEEQDLDPFEQISAEMGVANITIMQGSAYHIAISRSENYPVSCEVNDHTLTLSTDDQDTENVSASVTITVPQGVSLDDVKLEAGVGDSSITDVPIANLSVTEAVGDCDVQNLTVANLSLQLATGDCRISNCAIASATVEGEVADVVIEDSGTPQDTVYSLTTAAGTIHVNGETVKSPYQNGSGDRSVSVEVSVGDITVR